MKRLLVALTLACVLSVSALAGDIPTCGVVSSPPDGTEAAPSGNATAAPVDIPTGGVSIVLAILDLAF